MAYFDTVSQSTEFCSLLHDLQKKKEEKKCSRCKTSVI